jgi:hypothetical protein
VQRLQPLPGSPASTARSLALARVVVVVADALADLPAGGPRWVVAFARQPRDPTHVAVPIDLLAGRAHRAVAQRLSRPGSDSNASTVAGISSSDATATARVLAHPDRVGLSSSVRRRRPSPAPRIRSANDPRPHRVDQDPRPPELLEHVVVGAFHDQPRDVGAEPAATARASALERLRANVATS